MAKHSGRLELTWADKDKALLSTGDGVYDYTFADRQDPRVLEVRTLIAVDRVEEPAPTLDVRSDDLPEPTTDNLLVTGDAMHVLNAIRKTPEWAEKYVGRVRLVYIDPPFNTGQTFAHYEDSIDHSIWLTMLRDRLREIRPLLADDGSVWVHLDHVESHRCRAVLDEEFGQENFVGEVAWQKTTSPRNDTAGLSVSHDTLLVYRKSSRWRPNRLERLEQSNTSRYKSRDGDPIPWRDGDPTAGGARSNDETSIYAIQHPVTGGLMYPPAGRHWATSQGWMLEQLNQWAPYELRDIGDEEMRASLRRLPREKARPGVQAIMLAVPLAEAAAAARDTHANRVWPDLVFLNLDKERMQRKKHLVDEGRVPETLWFHHDVGGSMRGKNQIGDLFPNEHAFATPKPEELLGRIIQIATNPGDIVLDCFAGSGTTAAVAHKMGRRWVTSELLPVTVDTFTKPRLVKVVRGEDPGGVTSTAKRVDATDQGLPEGLTPADAHAFNAALNKAVKALAAEGMAVDDNTVRALKDITKTKEHRVVRWLGGGGFSHYVVGPSMYEVDEEDGEIYLSEAAVNGNWSKSVAAQLKFALTPEHPVFCGVRGKQRLAVIDGVADEVVVRTAVSNLADGERLVIVAKLILPEAEELLSILSPGSRLKKAPRDLFPKRTVK